MGGSTVIVWGEVTVGARHQQQGQERKHLLPLLQRLSGSADGASVGVKGGAGRG